MSRRITDKDMLLEFKQGLEDALDLMNLTEKTSSDDTVSTRASTVAMKPAGPSFKNRRPSSRRSKAITVRVPGGPVTRHKDKEQNRVHVAAGLSQKDTLKAQRALDRATGKTPLTAKQKEAQTFLKKHERPRENPAVTAKREYEAKLKSIPKFNPMTDIPRNKKKKKKAPPKEKVGTAQRLADLQFKAAKEAKAAKKKSPHTGTTPQATTEGTQYLGSARKAKAKMARIQALLRRVGPGFAANMTRNFVSKECGKVGHQPGSKNKFKLGPFGGPKD